VKPTLLVVVAALLIPAIPLPAKASLGGTVASVHTDQTMLHATLRATTESAYTVQEIKAPSGIVVREYVSTAGQVFAVTWLGPTRPNLQQVLGTYFSTFKQALQTKSKRQARGPRIFRQGDLVVEMGGHMRALVGRAYVTSMIPPEVHLEEIR
jgi:hypothetical protein